METRRKVKMEHADPQGQGRWAWYDSTIACHESSIAEDFVTIKIPLPGNLHWSEVKASPSSCRFGNNHTQYQSQAHMYYPSFLSRRHAIYLVVASSWLLLAYNWESTINTVRYYVPIPTTFGGHGSQKEHVSPRPLFTACQPTRSHGLHSNMYL